MNNLSWLMYIADVLPSIGTFSFVLGFIGTVAVFAFTFIYAMFKEDAMETIREDRWKDVNPFSWCWWLLLFVPLLVLSLLIPPKETIYMIAASEAGEVMVTSEYGKELIQELKLILDNQIEAYK